MIGFDQSNTACYHPLHPINPKNAYLLKKNTKTIQLIIINEPFSHCQGDTTYREIQWAIGWIIIVFNLLSRPPEPDFIEASRLIAGLLVGKLAFDEVWCQGAAKFPSNYLLARAPQLFTFRTQHVDQTTSYNQRDEWIRRVLIAVLNEWSCLVLS